ncbi:DUF6890 family protein [Methylomagnum ishizawai]|nr:hypothetical protein [Methylomagnum ishizawai]
MARHYFPGCEPDPETLGAALWLEQRYWEHMRAAVAAGIDKAFSGK